MKQKAIEIKRNKKGILSIFLFLLSIFCLGLIFILFPSFFISSLFKDEVVIIICGIFCCLSIFLLVPYFFIMISEKPGFIINEKGIINCSNWTNLGLISWEDIIKIERKNIGKGVYLFVHLKNSSEYISKIKNPLKRLNVVQYNLTYKTPIIINPRTLDCSLAYLEKTIREGYEQYK